MAHYTMTIQQILKEGYKIFDFEYPMFDMGYKKTFEELFIDYFMVEEIAHDNVGLFKLRLKTKLNLIMPYYNKLYETQVMEQRILDNYDVTEEYERIIEGSVNSMSKNLYKDAPKTRIDINNFDVVTNLSKNEGSSNNNANEKWKRTMKGNIGVQTDSDAIIKYWQSLRNITLEIFENELTELFMGVF